jgi:type IV pilus assembly protein PilV
MLNTANKQRGTTLIEVLVTLVIVAFGLLGVAGLQSKMFMAEVDSYQRAQALLTLQQMVERIRANTANANQYVTATVANQIVTENPVGTGDAKPTSCTAVTDQEDRDLCEWSNTLKGAGEKKGTANVGSMIGGRGCVTLVRAQDATAGTCEAGVYRVTVAWQGSTPTVSPTSDCGRGEYGSDDSLRRVVSAVVATPTLSCF